MNLHDPLPAARPETAPDAGVNDEVSVLTSLSARLVVLTILFVLIAMVLIYVPSVANFRNSWLNDRVAQARAAALILERSGPDALPKPLVDELLAGMQTTMIAVRVDQSRRLLAISDMPPMVDFEVDLRTPRLMDQIMGAFDILLFGSERAIRVVGEALGRGEFVEIVISERPLRAAMVAFSWSVLKVSLGIAAIVALLVFATLNASIGRPIRRLAAAVTRFRAHPEDARSLIKPGASRDELGVLERALADMQASLQQQLRQKEHLANLGLAVAKINHDLRNMLSSAQLMADRLGALPDPNVQRFVPKLLAALDRAISFCQSTLAYGKAQERMAVIAPLNLHALVSEVADQLGLADASTIAFRNEVPAGMMVRADADHLARVLVNLLRNARTALDACPAGQGASIRVMAQPNGKTVDIRIIDSGPGIPERQRATLFRAFSGSTSAGGSGLGLAIAQELLRGMGGTLVLAEMPDGAPQGTTFCIGLPASAPPHAG